VQPPLEEHLDGARLQRIADPLQRRRLLAGGEPVGQLGEAEPGLACLLLGPLVAVDPLRGRPDYVASGGWAMRDRWFGAVCEMTLTA